MGAKQSQSVVAGVQPSGICTQQPQIVVSPTQTVSPAVAAAFGQTISAVPFVQAPNTSVPPQVAYGQSLMGMPTAQIPNSYVQTTAGTRYQLAMGGNGQVVPAATRKSYGAPFQSVGSC